MGMIRGRECGDCIVCCVYYKIKVLNKPPMSHCPHVCAAEEENKGKRVCYTGVSKQGNCSIYKTRPQVCREYSCMWLRGYGKKEDRPDRCGVLFDTVNKIGNAVEAKPVWEDAADQPKGIAAIDRISNQTDKPVCVTSFYEKKLIRVVGKGV